MLVVFEREKIWHVVCSDFHLASTASAHLVMQHRFAFQIASHFDTLNVNRLGHTIDLLVVRIYFVSHIICRSNINFQELFSLAAHDLH